MEMTILKAYASIQLLPSVLAGRWWIVAAILLVTALLGRRVYCRFICPLGIAQSVVRLFLGKRRICTRLDNAVLTRPGKVQLIVRWTFFAAFLAVGLAGLGWQWLEPYGICFRASGVISAPEFELAAVAVLLVPLALVLLLAIVAGGRVWCNWICPVGTLLSLVGAFPWKGDQVKKCSHCEKCRRCFK